MKLDLSEWTRRDAAVAEASAVLRAKVAAAMPRLEGILAEHGVGEAFLFGSMASGSPRRGSDVDIAVASCPPARFYRLAAKLERALGLPLDLVDLDVAPADFAQQIRSHGRRIYPPARSTEGADDKG